MTQNMTASYIERTQRSMLRRTFAEKRNLSDEEILSQLSMS